MKRPVNLNLTTISFPVTAIVSILHRISGVLLFLAIPFMLFAFQQSLSSKQTFIALQDLFATPLVKSIVWLTTAALLYHIIAGIRHIAMDLGYFESKSAGKQGAVLVFLGGVLIFLGIGYLIW